MFEKQSLLTKVVIVLLSFFPIIGIPLILSFGYSAYDSRKKMFNSLNKASKELNSDSLIAFAKNWQRLNMFVIIIFFQNILISAGILYMLLN